MHIRELQEHVLRPLINFKDPLYLNITKLLILGAGLHLFTRLFLMYKEHFFSEDSPLLLEDRTPIRANECRNPEDMLRRIERSTAFRLQEPTRAEIIVPLHKSSAG